MRTAAFAARAVVLRAALFWIALRGAPFLVGAIAGIRPVRFFAPLPPILLLAVPALVLIDARVMREEIFLADLGIGARHIAAAALAIAIALELAVVLLLPGG